MFAGCDRQAIWRVDRCRRQGSGSGTGRARRLELLRRHCLHERQRGPVVLPERPQPGARRRQRATGRTLVTACNACFTNLRKTEVYLVQFPEIRAKVDQALAEGQREVRRRSDHEALPPGPGGGCRPRPCESQCETPADRPAGRSLLRLPDRPALTASRTMRTTR